jgi:hypothetical protein
LGGDSKKERRASGLMQQLSNQPQREEGVGRRPTSGDSNK